MIEYRVEGGWDSLRVDSSGGVRVRTSLDREVEGGPVGIANIIAIDYGHPRLTSTATLTITVTDVNDCPPQLLPPNMLHVEEETPGALIHVLTADDRDIWALGHGPPFVISLDSENSQEVKDKVSLNYLPRKLIIKFVICMHEFSVYQLLRIILSIILFRN